eukprot:2374047-Amphidinium_carterae.1
MTCTVGILQSVPMLPLAELTVGWHLILGRLRRIRMFGGVICPGNASCSRDEHDDPHRPMPNGGREPPAISGSPNCSGRAPRHSNAYSCYGYDYNYNSKKLK